MLALLSAADTPRDRALVAILFGTGLRVSEVVALDIEDVLEDHEGGCVMRAAAPRSMPQARAVEAM